MRNLLVVLAIAVRIGGSDGWIVGFRLLGLWDLTKCEGNLLPKRIKFANAAFGHATVCADRERPRPVAAFHRVDSREHAPVHRVRRRWRCNGARSQGDVRETNLQLKGAHRAERLLKASGLLIEAVNLYRVDAGKVDDRCPLALASGPVRVLVAARRDELGGRTVVDVEEVAALLAVDAWGLGNKRREAQDVSKQ